MTDDMGAIFREELRDLLESLERGLLDLKKRPEEVGLINQVFRDLHTVKGSGAMFGFTQLAAFIHDFETMFERVRSGLLPLTPDIVQLALAARDEIPRLVEDAPDTDGRRAAITIEPVHRSRRPRERDGIACGETDAAGDAQGQPVRRAGLHDERRVEDDDPVGAGGGSGGAGRHRGGRDHRRPVQQALT